MATTKKRVNFPESEEGIKSYQALKAMTEDDSFHTDASYSANEALYPDHLIPFIDKHMNYLRDHPELDSYQYISNLKLMTKIR